MFAPSCKLPMQTFWSVYMVFNTVEEFGLRYIVNSFTIMGQSFYFELKFAAVIFLMFFNGATKIFEMFVEPTMHKYQKKVDKAIEEAAALSEEFKNTAFTEKDDFIKAKGLEVYKIVTKQAALAPTKAD